MALTAKQIATSESRRARLIEICGSLPQVNVEPIGQHFAIRLGKKTVGYYQVRSGFAGRAITMEDMDLVIIPKTRTLDFNLKQSRFRIFNREMT